MPASKAATFGRPSYAMAAALKKTGFDLLIVGGLTDDGSTGAVPGALAEHLGLPCVTNARKAEIADGKLHVERETDSGYQKVQRPAAVAADDGADVRRTALRIAQRHHGRQEKDDRDAYALPISDSTSRSARAAPKRLLETFAPPPVRGKGEIVEAADGAAGARVIFDFLKAKKLV